MVRVAALLALVVLLTGCGGAPAAHAPAAAPRPVSPQRASIDAGGAVATFAQRWADRFGDLPASGSQAVILRRLRSAMLRSAATLRTPPRGNARVLSNRIRQLGADTIDAAAFALTQARPPAARPVVRSLQSVEIVLDTAFLLAGKGVAEQIPAAVGPASSEVKAAEAAYRAARG